MAMGLNGDREFLSFIDCRSDCLQSCIPPDHFDKDIPRSMASQRTLAFRVRASRWEFVIRTNFPDSPNCNNNDVSRLLKDKCIWYPNWAAFHIRKIINVVPVLTSSGAQRSGDSKSPHNDDSSNSPTAGIELEWKPPMDYERREECKRDIAQCSNCIHFLSAVSITLATGNKLPSLARCSHFIAVYRQIIRKLQNPSQVPLTAGIYTMKRETRPRP